MQDEATQRAIAGQLAVSGISVVTLPQTNLYLQGRDHVTAVPRGFTALRALREAGVTVAGGADNLQDPFNPVGRGDPLETAALLVAGAHFLPHEAFNAVSQLPHTIIANGNNQIQPGAPADLLLVRATNVRELIAFASHERAVVYRGRMVSNTLINA
jgi:cytosine deaminase